MMDIVKKNLVSIIFGVIAIVAVVATFYPLGGYFTDLQGDVGKREAQWKKAKDIYTKRHTLPLTSLGKDGQPEDLGVFPNPKITRDAKEYMNSLVSESKRVFQAAVDFNKTECAVRPKETDDAAKLLLVRGSLPEPQGSVNDEFKKALPPEIERLRLSVLNGGFPPGTEEMAKATQELADKFDKKCMRPSPTEAAINEQQVVEALAVAQAALPNEMRDKAATSHTMYVDPTAIVIPPDFLPTNPIPPTPDKIFFAQAALWVEEDICRAIAEVNAKATNVMDAPVKRLLLLDVPYGAGMYLRMSADGSGAPMGGDPMASRFRNSELSVSPGATAAPSKPPALPTEKQDYTATVTGRTSNSLYDVVTITLDVHVDATKIPQLLAALSRNRLVTVRNIISLSRVDNADLLQQNFVYGSAPVADLKLDLELLQMREWTVPYMPEAVKTALGASAWISELHPTAGQRAAPGGASGGTPAPTPVVPAAQPTAPPNTRHR